MLSGWYLPQEMTDYQQKNSADVFFFVFFIIYRNKTVHNSH